MENIILHIMQLEFILKTLNQNNHLISNDILAIQNLINNLKEKLELLSILSDKQIYKAGELIEMGK